jgi:cytochrome c-type biogenesis protein
VLRRGGRLVSRVGGLLLVIAGGYVAYYGWYEIGLQHGAPAHDPVIAAAGAIQRRLAAGLDRAGVIGAGLSLVALIAVATVLSRRRHARVRDHQQHGTGHEP